VPALAAAGFVPLAAWLRFGIDDAFINFRYAANLAAGLGPVFNPGERVEGYTAPAWVLLLAGLHRLGAPLLGTAHVLGIAASAATVLATGALAAALAPRLRVGAGALAALLVALHPGVLFWTASGMETPVFMLLVLLSVAAARWPAAAGALCGLAALTRPEAILFGTGVGAALAATGGRRALARFAPGFAGPLAALELFRLAYYGAPLPNTFYAKVGLQVPHCLWYLWQFVRDGGWVFAPALLALAGPQRRTAALWLALVAAYGAWVVAIGGDVFAFHRFLVPVVPLLAVLAALGADALLGAWPRATTALLLLAAALWAASLRGTYAYAWSAAQGVDAITATLRPLGLALGERAPPGTTVAMLSIGALPFYAGPGIRVIDMMGLADAHVARAGVRVPDGLPAHARYDNDYVLARRPELILMAPPGAVPACARPLTAAAVRADPCGAASWGRVAIETGLYGRDCPAAPPPACPYVLPVQIDLERPDERVRFEGAYERVSVLPKIGPINAYRRRDWLP